MSQIHDVIVRPLKLIADDRGSVLHMLRNDSIEFEEFGEIYFSEVKNGVIKGWKKNNSVNQLFAVPWGDIQLVLIDLRDSSPTNGLKNVYYIGRSKVYSLIKIPKGVWYGFKGLSEKNSIIANMISLYHSECSFDNLPLSSDKLNFDWNDVSCLV